MQPAEWAWRWISQFWREGTRAKSLLLQPLFLPVDTEAQNNKLRKFDCVALPLIDTTQKSKLTFARVMKGIVDAEVTKDLADPRWKIFGLTIKWFVLPLLLQRQDPGRILSCLFTQFACMQRAFEGLNAPVNIDVAIKNDGRHNFWTWKIREYLKREGTEIKMIKFKWDKWWSQRKRSEARQAEQAGALQGLAGPARHGETKWNRWDLAGGLKGTSWGWATGDVWTGWREIQILGGISR